MVETTEGEGNIIKDRNKLDSLLLNLASSLSLFFSLLRIIIRNDILSFIVFLPLLILGWLLPIYVGYFKGAVYDNWEERFRGWFYMLGGCLIYTLNTLFTHYLVNLPMIIWWWMQPHLVFLVSLLLYILTTFISIRIILEKIVFWFLKIPLTKNHVNNEESKRLIISILFSVGFLAIGLQNLTLPWYYAILLNIRIIDGGVITYSIISGAIWTLIGAIFYRTSAKWSFIRHNSHLLEIREFKGRIFPVEKVGMVLMIVLLLFLQLNAVIVFIGILIILALLLYFLMFYSEIWELEIKIKESELDKMSEEERERMLKFKKEHEEAKKRVSLFIRERCF